MPKLTVDDLPDHGAVDTRAADDTNSDYASLAGVLNDAFEQSSIGKGRVRHSNNKPFLEQPIMEIARMIGDTGGHAYQIMKKAQEANRMVRRNQYNAAVDELYGVIIYAAAAVILVREIETEAGPIDTSGE